MCLQPQAVVRRHHARRQRLPDDFVIDVGRHVGDDGALRLETFDPGQRVVDAEMADMAGVAQPVDDPEVEVFKRAPARVPECTALCCSTMTGFKPPRAIVFGPIPKTSTGKIQKFLLRI